MTMRMTVVNGVAGYAATFASCARAERAGTPFDFAQGRSAPTQVRRSHTAKSPACAGLFTFQSEE